MFGSGRRPAKTRSELFRDELGETFDHLKQAASHGADTISTAVQPRMSAAKSIAVGTAAGAMARMAAARRERMRQIGEARRERMRQIGEARRERIRRAGEAARKASPMGRKKRARDMARRQRGYRLAGLLAIGAAVGAAGALVRRRRRQTSWEVYDTSTRPPQKPVEMSEASSGPPAQSTAQSGKSARSASQSEPPASSQTRQPMPGKGTRGVGPLADQARSALSGATEPGAPEAEATSPVTQPSSDRRR